MLYGLLRIIFTFIYSVIFPTTVKGKENIPKEGAVILAANHLSNWDPPLVGKCAYFSCKKRCFR